VDNKSIVKIGCELQSYIYFNEQQGMFVLKTSNSYKIDNTALEERQGSYKQVPGFYRIEYQEAPVTF
jgi:hypothetical protein